MNDSMNAEGVYRTAPATAGLLKSDEYPLQYRGTERDKRNEENMHSLTAGVQVITAKCCSVLHLCTVLHGKPMAQSMDFIQASQASVLH